MPKSAGSSKSPKSPKPTVLPHDALDPMSAMKHSLEQFVAFFQAKGSELARPGGTPLELDVGKLEQLQSEFIERASQLWNDSLHNSIQLKDRRFSS